MSLLLAGALMVATALILGTAWNLYVTSRFHKVTMAQWRRASAYRALTTAYLTRADPAQAKAEVAAADEAALKAEARLPRHSRSTRQYFANKAVS